MVERFDVRAPDDVAYRHVRDTVTRWAEEFSGLDRVPVPACPGWTVRDVLAHLVGICWKVARRSGGAVGPPERSIEDATPAELAGLWRSVGATADRVLLERPGRRGAVMVMDALTHELDMRQALGLPRPVDHPALRGTLNLLTTGFGRSVRGRGLPAVRFRTSGAEWVSGRGEPGVVVEADRLDLLRSLSGRRAHAQISRLAWSLPVDPWLPAFEWGPFHPPATAVEESCARVEAG